MTVLQHFSLPLLLHEDLQVLHALRMFCHVRGQDHVHEALANVLVQVDSCLLGGALRSKVLGEHLKPITGRVVSHDLEAEGHVHVLEDALVVVGHGLGRHRLGKEQVAPARVPHVMYGAGDEDHQVVKGAHLTPQVCGLQEPFHCHQHVRPVRGTMVGHICLIELVHVPEKAYEAQVEAWSIWDLALLVECPDYVAAVQGVRAQDLQWPPGDIWQCGEGQRVKVQTPSPLQQELRGRVAQRSGKGLV
mmetsp:Transcript_108102/g.338128  ORF Transcript_108102/g.338128 Transcript_108102/m.338128 type:complete len:247 (-) Transcript_108102:753-1493(-)